MKPNTSVVFKPCAGSWSCLSTVRQENAKMHPRHAEGQIVDRRKIAKALHDMVELEDGHRCPVMWPLRSSSACPYRFGLWQVY